MVGREALLLRIDAGCDKDACGGIAGWLAEPAQAALELLLAIKIHRDSLLA